MSDIVGQWHKYFESLVTGEEVDVPDDVDPIRGEWQQNPQNPSSPTSGENQK
jgi:hypothetical protein